MSTTKMQYGTRTAITCTVNSLASSATAGRECTAIDNSSDLFLDAHLFVRISFPNTAPANDKAVYIWAYSGDDNAGSTRYTGGCTGSDAAYTRDDPTTLKLVGVIPIPTQNKDYDAVFSIAAAFGGVLPKKWGVVVQNYAGQTLNATNNALSYEGVYAQHV